jgi:alkanesulfonate monooxygenase SsuD/methylene tetrahydromethanopterin reductase-like flavin-dependent oxidoreductase (luciferase family)
VPAFDGVLSRCEGEKGDVVKVGAQYQGDDLGPKSFAQRAEATGFDSVWCGDHVAHLIDGLTALGAYAGATEHITIGLNLLVAPYRPAAVMAKALATVALMAPGRVVAGFGVGGEFPYEFAATGADLRTRGAYTDEALGIIERLWTGQPLTFDGRWARFHNFVLEPAPDPAPEIWIGGRSEAALRRAVRSGAGYVPYLVSPQQLADRSQRLDQLAAEAGRAAGSLKLGCLVTMIPAPSADAAVERGLNALNLSGLTPDSIRSMYLIGDDDAMLARVRLYSAAGVDHLILGCLPGTGAERDEFFAACERLLPLIRALPHREL